MARKGKRVKLKKRDSDRTDDTALNRLRRELARPTPKTADQPVNTQERT